MSPLPDRKRPNLIPPARTLAKSLARIALATTWRGLHPRARETFHEASAPPPIRRLYYVTTDGWKAPLFCVEPRASGAGEPVVLLHGLALGPHTARYGRGPTLANQLAAAGFRVYCASHRGDHESAGVRNLHLDGVLEYDIPALTAAVLEDSGYASSHLIGHGLGGQLALVAATRQAFASVTAIASPVRFRRLQSQTLGAHRLVSMLPSHWQVPTSTLARLASPWVDQSQDLGEHLVPGSTAPPRLRGALHHTAGDLAAGVLDQVGRWYVEGSLTSRDGRIDYVEAMHAARSPLHLVHAPGDALGRDDSPEAITSRWSGPVSRLDLPEHLARLDCLLADDAPEHVFAPVVSWLNERRRAAW